MQAAASDDLPLVIDLDGTLITTEFLHETFLDVLRLDPLALWRLPYKLIVGRAAVREFLAVRSDLDVETWPVRQDLLGYLENEAASGRRIVLVTTADRAVAEVVVRRFPFISQVIASDGWCNKADKLIKEFPQGFILCGAFSC